MTNKTKQSFPHLFNCLENVLEKCNAYVFFFPKMFPQNNTSYNEVDFSYRTTPSNRVSYIYYIYLKLIKIKWKLKFSSSGLLGIF